MVPFSPLFFQINATPVTFLTVIFKHIWVIISNQDCEPTAYQLNLTLEAIPSHIERELGYVQC